MLFKNLRLFALTEINLRKSTMLLALIINLIAGVIVALIKLEDIGEDEQLDIIFLKSSFYYRTIIHFSIGSCYLYDITDFPSIPSNYWVSQEYFW